jgi:hypothetical protein
MFVKSKVFAALASAGMLLSVAHAQSTLRPMPGASAGISSVALRASPATSSSSAPQAQLQRQQARMTLEQLAAQDSPSNLQTAKPAVQDQNGQVPAFKTPAAMPSEFSVPQPRPVLVAVTGKPGAESAQIALGSQLYTVRPGARLGDSKWALERIDVAAHQVVLAHATSRHHVKDVPIWFVRTYEGSPSYAPTGTTFFQTSHFGVNAATGVPTLPPPVTASYR